MREVGAWFVVGLIASGVAIGLALAGSPRLRALPVPSLVWPLIVSLVADLALMPLARQGRIAPIRMEHRFLGVIGGAIMIALILAWTGVEA